MPKIDIDELVKILPKLVRENDTVKGAILTALTGVVATRDDIRDLIREMDERFNAVQQQMDERFKAAQQQMDDKFNGVQSQLKTISESLSDLKRSFGAPFEQFARNVVSRILEGEGYPAVKLDKVKLTDENGDVFPSTKEVEIDGISDDPPVIVEITSVLRDVKKVDDFLKKKAFIERMRGMEYRGFLVASGSELGWEDLADVAILLKKNKAELLNL
ncbi:MAG TPA: hypothetical protein VKM55_29940 [Candidatus Lokiarchaeia archaeon]|nr:hypothetical protein [Candidatus Lokiarchaeia archaeon]